MNNIDARFLKKMIKEVLNKKIEEENLEECGMDMDSAVNAPEGVEASSVQLDPDGYEGFMAKGNLYKMAKSATELHNIIQDNENLEPWVEEKIAVAAEMIKTVADYMEYSKMAKK